MDGPLATKFVLSCIQQWILTPGMLGKVKDHLDHLAKQQSPVQSGAGDAGRKLLELERVNADLEKVSRNMALAEGPEQFGAISAVFNELKRRKAELEREIVTLEFNRDRRGDLGEQVALAERLADGLTRLAAGADSLPAAGRAIRTANAKLYLRFAAEQRKKRILNVVAGGILTFCTAPPPIQVYDGRTSRQHVKKAAEKRKNTREPASRSSGDCVDSDPEGKSIGSGSRGDWTPIELFGAVVEAWEDHLHAFLVAA